MRVALLADFNPEVVSAGGVRPYVESLSRHLRELSIDVLTVAAGSRFSIAADQAFLPVRRSGSTAYWLASLTANVRALPIHADSVVHVQRPDDLFPIMLSGVGKTWVATLHGNPLQGLRERGNLIAYAAYAGMEALVLRRVHRCIFVDSGAAEVYIRRYPWLEGRFDVIPNAVDIHRFKPENRSRAKAKWGFRGTVLLFAGRLRAEKRVPKIVTAFGNLRDPSASLVIAGDGPDAEAVGRAARGLNVQLVGGVSREDMPSLMNASDALVMYSTREGLPAVALEALACGLPVICTRVGALGKVVRQGQTGLFVASEGELTDAMARVCSGELPISSAMRESALGYSWDELAPRIVQSYLRAQETAGAP